MGGAGGTTVAPSDPRSRRPGRSGVDGAQRARRRSPLPRPWARVGPGGDWIVFENSAPFSWTRRVLTELEAPPYGVIAYGKGQNFPRTLRYLLTVEAEVESLNEEVDQLESRNDELEAALDSVCDQYEQAQGSRPSECAT